MTGGLPAMKALNCGGNFQALRDSIATESVDLIYLDPPFNSNATYNVGLLVIGCVAEAPLVAKNGLYKMMAPPHQSALRC